MCSLLVNFVYVWKLCVVLPFPALQKSLGQLPLNVHAYFHDGVIWIALGYTDESQNKKWESESTQNFEITVVLKLRVFHLH